MNQQQPLLSHITDIIRGGDLEGLKDVLLRPGLCATGTRRKPWPQAALDLAIEADQVEMARYLIMEFKLDVNGSRRKGLPVLCGAICRGQEAMAHFLIREANAHPEDTTSSGQTPLMMAAHKGLCEVVRVLALEMGVDLRAKDREGRDVMYHVAEGGSVEVASFLVDQMGLSIDSTYKGCHQLLHIASQKGHLPLIKWLVGRGAKVTVKSSFGMPHHHAASSGHLDTVQYYIDNARVPIESREGRRQRTALHFAAEKDHLDVVRWLVEGAGADVGAVDSKGIRSEDLAGKYQHKEVVDYLEPLRFTKEVRTLNLCCMPIAFITSLQTI